MANIQNVKFYRNATPLASYEAAAADIKTRGTQEKEGTLILSRYTENNESRTIAGLVNIDGSVTIVTTEYSIIPANQVSVADSGSVFEGTNVEEVLAEIAEKIEAATVASADKTVVVTSSNAGTDLAVNIDGKTIVKETATGATQGQLKADLQLVQLTAAEVTALSDSNVKEAFKLIYATDAQRNAIGNVIKVYKDSSLYSAYLGHVDDALTSASDPTVVPGSGDAALCFIYQKADGTYELVAVNVESFLSENEFKDGLQVSNHEVSVKLSSDTESQKYLSIETIQGQNGALKVSGIDAAIADAEITTGDVNGTASTVAITDNTSPATGKNISITVEGNNVPLTGYTPLSPTGSTQETVAIAATDTTNDAFAKVEKAINVNEQVVAAALNDLNSTKVDVISVNGVQSKTPAADDVVASVTIDGGDVELTGYTKPASASAIAATDSVNEAIGKLEKGLENAVSGGLTGVSVNNVALTPSNNSVNVAIAGATTAATATGNEAIVVTTDSTTGAVTLGLAVLDAGTY